MDADTIFALATARGKSGVAVVRVSGTGAAEVPALFGFRTVPVRQASLRKLREASGDLIDEALVLRFARDHSFTGEEVIELHLHGSLAIVDAVLRQLGAEAGFRIAEPGEFTRRALQNDRLDLAQVEGLGDLIEAETEAQRRQAMQVFSGKLGTAAEGWRADLLRAAALIEATIDFADEEVPEDVSPEVTELLARVSAALEAEIAGSRIAERVRAGFEIAIVGPPNAGKSTLLNALAGREAAITSEIAGTTRDVIEVRMDLGGIPVTLLDTAGLRETGDVLEQIGVDRARDRAAAADLRIFLTDGQNHMDGVDRKPGDLVLRGKADLGRGDAGLPGVSGLTGQGIDSLVSSLQSQLEARVAGAGLATHARHRQAMQRAAESLVAARNQLDTGLDSELAAEDLRRGVLALESLVGRIDVEAVLGEIFSSFCIGK
ncbi:MAG: tRNA uridine-5-carboxymethylaminomethyl(34) synthesis GTPase MnmE [Pseudomonadota bacterium]